MSSAWNASSWTSGRAASPIKLRVYARYTRRGGLDINPLRTSHRQALPANVRTAPASNCPQALM